MWRGHSCPRGFEEPPKPRKSRTTEGRLEKSGSRPTFQFPETKHRAIVAVTESLPLRTPTQTYVCKKIVTLRRYANRHRETESNKRDRKLQAQWNFLWGRCVVRSDAGQIKKRTGQSRSDKIVFRQILVGLGDSLTFGLAALVRKTPVHSGT